MAGGTGETSDERLGRRAAVCRRLAEARADTADTAADVCPEELPVPVTIERRGRDASHVTDAYRIERDPYAPYLVPSRGSCHTLLLLLGWSHPSG